MANVAHPQWSRPSRSVFATVLFGLILQAPALAQSPAGFTNSLGMRMVPIRPGTFRMGEARPTLKSVFGQAEYLVRGDWDEQPVHEVAITQPFFIADEEVTSA